MKKVLCLTLAILTLLLYGGTTLVYAAVDITVDIYRHPYNDIYGNDIYVGPNPIESSTNSSGSTSSSSSSIPASNSNTGIYGSGAVSITSNIKASSSNELYGSTVSVTVKDSGGYIYSNYDYVDGCIYSDGNSNYWVDKRTITLPGNDVYKLNAVVTGQNGEFSSVTKEFDIRAIRSIPENTFANFDFISKNCINATWAPVENAESYGIYVSRESGFSENYSYYFKTVGYNNCTFFIDDGFYNDLNGKWQFYVVAFNGDLRVGRSQEFTYCINKDLAASFKDKNLEAAVRQAINKPSGDILKSDLLGIIGLDARYRNISDLDGLQQLVNLEALFMDGNQICDIRPLSELKKLNAVFMSHNNINSIEALKNNTELCSLDLSFNSIRDISALKNLINIKVLYLNGNDITNYTYVPNYYSLISRDFEMNPLIVNGLVCDYYLLDDNNNLKVPLRLCAESAGLTASWNAVSKEITLKDNFNELKMVVGKASYIFNGTVGCFDSAVDIANGRTMLLIEPIAKLFNRSVSIKFVDGSIRLDISQNRNLDLNDDGVINMMDIIIISRVFNTTVRDAYYNLACDLNSDGAINMADVIILAAKFNTKV